MLEPEEIVPTPPSKGPPLPRKLEQRWPVGIDTILKPPIPWRIHLAREGIRKINEVIAIYEGHEKTLDKFLVERLRELRKTRDVAVRRVAFMTRFRR